MKKVLILSGLPTSGKTTYALNLTKKGYKRVNKDDLRAMLDNSKWSKNNEKLVLKIRDMIILESLEAGFNVVVDDTNLHPKHLEHITSLVKGKAEIETKFFEITVEEAIKRDLKRPNSVGEKVIKDMYKTYLQPKEIYKPNPNLPDAYIFDIDGTLALKKDRSPFDWDKVDEDELNDQVADIFYELDDFKRIIFSGRDEVCREKTEQWLKKYNLDYDLLFMRKQGDTRKDFIVKKEFFDQIKDKYSIRGIFDDRQQVVDLWRSLGLTCFQVAEGDF